MNGGNPVENVINLKKLILIIININMKIQFFHGVNNVLLQMLLKIRKKGMN